MKIPYIVILSSAGPAGDGKYTEWIGTIHNGEAQEFRDSVLFPSGKSLEVRSVVPGNDGTVRIALKGIDRNSVTAGALIVPSDFPVAYTRTAYGRLSQNQLRKETPVQVMESDTLPLDPGSGEAAKVTVHEGGVKLTFSRRVLLCPGETYLLTVSGNASGTFVPFLVQSLPLNEEKTVQKRLSVYTARMDTTIGLWRFRALFSGFTRVPSADLRQFLENVPDGCSIADGYLMRATWRAEFERLVLEQVASNPGIRILDIAKTQNVDRDLVRRVAADLSGQSRISSENGRLYPFVRSTGDGKDLSPAARHIRKVLEERGVEGINLGEPAFKNTRKVAEELIIKGYAIPLTNDILYSETTLGTCSRILLSGKRRGDRVTFQELKEKLSVSRKYALPIIERLVEAEVLERVEDELRVSGSAEIPEKTE